MVIGGGGCLPLGLGLSASSWGGGCLPLGQGCLPLGPGCLGMSASGGVHLPGGHPLGRHQHWADTLPLARHPPPWADAPCPLHSGIHTPCPLHAGIQPPTPTWTEFLTHACESIAFPQQLLRAVIIFNNCVNYL